jgi:hypothetical protein
MSSRRMSLLPRATLHSDSEHSPLIRFWFWYVNQSWAIGGCFDIQYLIVR